MERKTALGAVVVALGVVAIAGVAALGPTATCESQSGEIGGIAPIEFIEFANGDVVYSRDGGASICHIDATVLGVPGGLLLAGVGLFVLGS